MDPRKGTDPGLAGAVQDMMLIGTFIRRSTNKPEISWAVSAIESCMTSTSQAPWSFYDIFIAFF
ncbi:MAG: hypothetical protein WBN68_12665 [Sedimenticolaceae bacterium]